MPFCVFVVTIGIDCGTHGLVSALDGSSLSPKLLRSRPSRVDIVPLGSSAALGVCISKKTGVQPMTLRVDG
jgi:hypothetical protein